RRFGSRGAYLQGKFINMHSKSENENIFESERVTFEEDIEEIATQNQFINEENSSDRYSFGITQRSVLRDKLFLDLAYDLNAENSTNERNVFELDADTREYTEFNEFLSN